IAGIIGVITIHKHWAAGDISVNHTAVDTINNESQGNDLTSIIHEAEKNVMLIEGQTEGDTVTGSGFLYNEYGDIVTNAHVVKDVEAITVRTANARIYPAAVIGIGKETDIAVIR